MGDLEGEDTNLFYALYVLSTATDGRLRLFTQQFTPKDKSTSFVMWGSHNVYPVEEPQQHRHNTVLQCCYLVNCITKHMTWCAHQMIGVFSQ